MFLVCGSLGAVFSVALLLMIPTDGTHNGYRELIVNDPPVLVLAAGIGFAVGVLIALLWSVLQRLFPANAPGA
jgi:hypothetical protein